MSLYTDLISRAIFPLHERVKGHRSVKWRQELESSQWLKREAIEAIQLINLRRFLVEAGECVPYYRNLFQTLSFSPAELTSTADLSTLPLLDKTLIRENTESLRSEKATTLKRFNTGGSTGQPLIFYLGQDRISHDVAAKWRATRWWDVDIGDSEVVIWGSPIELGTQDHLRVWRDRLFRSELIPAADLTESRLAEIVEEICQRKPKMVFGYPSVISMLADHAMNKGCALNTLGVKVVFVTSECLYEHQRQLIESAFGCQVANGYGSRDAGFLAHQCPQGSLHLSAEDIVVEIVDEHGKCLPEGQAGEIVVTHTATGEFPFIRYRTGDMGCISNEPCPCGRGLPVLKDVLGRANDFLVSSDGKKFHGSSFTYVMRDIDGLESFKIIQESRQLVNVKLMTDRRYQADSENRISRAFKQRLGDGVQVSFDYCQSIPPEKSGKYRYVVSHAD
ncbi:phenylacetate--CoA ligase family protein [Aestuariicella hydrocarbonica]|uniref:Phenylacetate--CoA ligase family protein n=1 Tax=Pseudomaricurvus hydrocarbonicus TaxID=1470433 RepID=A0A9E5MLJ5_9GAMM|nr:AMP-binding protein [Aestuariicella hydrocarbonica]NHO64688.1 phenylacetate--CoA ligase family protein [Aestuariicella hydrocarbonica]